MFRNLLTKLETNIRIQNVLKQQQIRSLAQSVENTVSNVTDNNNYELKEEYIQEAIKSAPALAAVSSQMWHKCHQTFLNHGLETQSFFKIITGNPKVLMRSPQRIIETLEFWRSCQFGEHFLFLLLTKYPEYMDVNDQRSLLKQIGFLRSYTATNKNVWKLLMNCPTLISESEEKVEAKIKYLKDVMRIEIPEIVKSEALSKTLDNIRCRHVFLERLGLFKPRPLKADPNEPTKNPRLYKITDTSEKTFATKVCHVSFVEYETFKELFQRELNRVSDDIDGDEYNGDGGVDDDDGVEEYVKLNDEGKKSYNKKN